MLTCSVLLTAGDFVNDNHQFTPAAEWKQQQARAERVQDQLHARLGAVAHVRIVDAAYHVHPDVCLRFAALALRRADGGNEAGEERL